ncbi:STAS domain-containing protein [Kitasatospora sp. NPDC059571]|uniref:STAS domain-containing protein n=1 Tax=Kitasatospora sp. NPDC059571 TaxID=3346871 RepID=UPI0036CFDCC7
MFVPAPAGTGISSVHRSALDRATVVRLRGELDVHAAARLEPELLRLASDSGRFDLVCDLAGVTFCDSSGAGLFVRMSERCGTARRVMLRHIGRQPSRVIRLMGLHHRMHCDFGGPGMPPEWC